MSATATPWDARSVDSALGLLGPVTPVPHDVEAVGTSPGLAARRQRSSHLDHLSSRPPLVEVPEPPGEALETP